MAFGFYNPEKLTESQRQAAHFRRLQWILIIGLFVLVFAGLVGVYYAQIILHVPDGDITQLYYILSTFVTALVGVIGWAYGTSISSSKTNDTMRHLVNQGTVSLKEPAAGTE